MTHTVIGSARHLRRKDRSSSCANCDLDGLMLIFADYGEGLRVTGREILPSLRRGMIALKDWIAPARTALAADGHAGGFCRA